MADKEFCVCGQIKGSPVCRAMHGSTCLVCEKNRAPVETQVCGDCNKGFHAIGWRFLIMFVAASIAGCSTRTVYVPADPYIDFTWRQPTFNHFTGNASWKREDLRVWKAKDADAFEALFSDEEKRVLDLRRWSARGGAR